MDSDTVGRRFNPTCWTKVQPTSVMNYKHSIEAAPTLKFR